MGGGSGAGNTQLNDQYLSADSGATWTQQQKLKVSDSDVDEFGGALSLSGDTRGAAAQFEEAIRLSPGYSQSHYSLGLLLASGGRDIPK
jgi:hypothetical protein